MHTASKTITTLLISFFILNFCLAQSGNKIPTLAQIQSWVSMGPAQFDTEVRQLGFKYVEDADEAQSKKMNVNKRKYSYLRRVTDENDDRIIIYIIGDNENRIDMRLYEDILTSYQSSLATNRYVLKNCIKTDISYEPGNCKAYENGQYRLVVDEPTEFPDEASKRRNYNSHATICKKLPENNAYEIEVDMGNVSENKVTLGYYFMGKTYAKDSATVSNGKAIFKGSEKLQTGIYYMAIKGTASSQFLVDDNNQKFQLGLSMGADPKSIIISSVSHSKENKLFNDFGNFIGDKIKQYNELASSDTTGQKKIMQEVRNYQEELIKNEPNSFTALMIKASQEPDIPASFNNIADKDKREMQRYLYYKQHFFDRIDLSDERLLGTDIYATKIDYYVNKLTVQQPDSVIVAIDYLVALAAKNKETYKNCVIYLLNLYAKSKTVCFDKCYVHLIDKYYNNTNAPFGGAFWISDEEKSKITAAAEKLRPITCGSVAPNILLASITDPENKFSLKTIKARYSILFFWQPDRCSDCETAITKLKEVYPGFRSKGIEIIGIGIRWKDNEANPAVLKDYLVFHDMPWLTVMDAGNRSEDLVKKFDFTRLPHFYILDEEKRILLKNISLESLIQYVKDK